MKYAVTFKIDGRYVVEVEANSIEETKDKAETKMYEADMNKMEYCDLDAIIVEDDKDIVWEA